VVIQYLVALHLLEAAAAQQRLAALLLLEMLAVLAVGVIAVRVVRLRQRVKEMLGALETVMAVEAVAAQVRLV
jgi:hypothetical protein